MSKFSKISKTDWDPKLILKVDLPQSRHRLIIRGENFRISHQVLIEIILNEIHKSTRRGCNEYDKDQQTIIKLPIVMGQNTLSTR